MARIVDTVWNQLFSKYPILEEIEKHGYYEISAEQILPFKEPRLVTKFDYSMARPEIMRQNHICILPNTTGTYILGKFNMFQDFPKETEKVYSVSFPDWIESIDISNISSEAIAIATAEITPIFSDFFEDDRLVSTVSGRLGSGQFDFFVGKNQISVNSSQMEIDGALESPDRFVLLEGKNILHDDFLIRQLYYPYRAFQSRMQKPIHSVFITYSNGIFRLMEYRFAELKRYDSCQFVREKKYCISNVPITQNDIQTVWKKTKIKDTTYGAPFIQCDSFSKIINILEVLEKNGSMTETDIVDLFGFTPRQGNYYYNGCRYLGLVQKDNQMITLTDRGKTLISLSYKDRQLQIVSYILEHSVFHHLMEVYFKYGTLDREYIKKAMQQYQVCQETLIARRSSSAYSWMSWIIGLIG